LIKRRPVLAIYASILLASVSVAALVAVYIIYWCPDAYCENQFGACRGSVKLPYLCVKGEWSPCDSLAYKTHSAKYENGPESLCDDVDNNCDGVTDEFSVIGPDMSAYEGIGVACGVGACTGGTTLCNADGTGITCSTFHLVSPEDCDGQDDDCNGHTDDGFEDSDGDKLANCVDPDDDNDGDLTMRTATQLTRTRFLVLLNHAI
jgi:hypothetical protein